MNKRNIYVTMPTLAPLNDVNIYMQGIWERGIMTHNGPLVQEFEKMTEAFLGTKNLVAVTNGTIAIQMAIRALGLKGEIITTPFTFIATISAIMWEGCTPVFADIDPDTLNIDPSKIEAKITKNTVAILPVHVFGNPCHIEEIKTIADKHKLKVIYDAAHGVGVNYKGKCLFDYGNISTTSFHATKMLNTAEGGACFTQDNEMYEKLKRIRFFGFNSEKEVVEDGSNFKMTEVHAAVGLANLTILQKALNDRKEKYFLYIELLSINPNFKFQKINHDSNYSYFPLIFRTEEALLKAEKALQAENIFPRRYFYPSVNTFSQIVQYTAMPQSEDISKRILCLPLYYTLSKQSIHDISKIITDISL
jgi:dTDP-4-amino-4,6-dideoxygalactose transaminase